MKRQGVLQVRQTRLNRKMGVLGGKRVQDPGSEAKRVMGTHFDSGLSVQCKRHQALHGVRAKVGPAQWISL